MNNSFEVAAAYKTMAIREATHERKCASSSPSSSCSLSSSISSSTGISFTSSLLASSPSQQHIMIASSPFGNLKQESVGNLSETYLDSSMSEDLENNNKLLNNNESSIMQTTDKQAVASSCSSSSSGNDVSFSNSRVNRFFPDGVVDILNKWFFENQSYPYPDENTTNFLASEANISAKQVRKWFANKRVRSNKCYKQTLKAKKTLKSSTIRQTKSVSECNFQQNANVAINKSGKNKNLIKNIVSGCKSSAYSDNEFEDCFEQEEEEEEEEKVNKKQLNQDLNGTGSYSPVLFSSSSSTSTPSVSFTSLSPIINGNNNLDMSEYSQKADLNSLSTAACLAKRLQISNQEQEQQQQQQRPTDVMYLINLINKSNLSASQLCSHDSQAKSNNTTGQLAAAAATAALYTPYVLMNMMNQNQTLATFQAAIANRIFNQNALTNDQNLIGQIGQLNENKNIFCRRKANSIGSYADLNQIESTAFYMQPPSSENFIQNNEQTVNLNKYLLNNNNNRNEPISIQLPTVASLSCTNLATNMSYEAQKTQQQLIQIYNQQIQLKQLQQQQQQFLQQQQTPKNRKINFGNVSDLIN